MKRIIFSAVVFLMAAVPLLGQPKPVPRDEYYRIVNEASRKGRQGSLRITTRREYFENGKATDSNEEIQEYLGPEKSRSLRTEKSGGKVEKKEIIIIGTTYYCRTNDKDWTVSTTYCDRQGFYGIPYPSDDKYTLERVLLEGKEVTLYTNRSEFRDGPEKTLRYWQNKYWIGDDGRLLREEVDHGTLGSEAHRGKWLVTFDYDPKGLKIEAPEITSKPKT